jgi:hypothetical protein
MMAYIGKQVLLKLQDSPMAVACTKGFLLNVPVLERDSNIQTTLKGM